LAPKTNKLKCAINYWAPKMGAKSNGPNVFEGANCNGRQNQVGAKIMGSQKLGVDRDFLLVEENN
jgi:hypothetical protein